MDLDRLWKNTLAELQVSLDSYTFQFYIAKIQLIALQNNNVTISCSNFVLADQIQKKYLHLIKNALDNQTKLDTKIEVIVQNLSHTPETINNTPLFSYSPKPPQNDFSGLHPKYTFENLIVGNSNNFAYAAAQGIVKNPGLSYNPFFIWGGVGVGKTHLMQAIGHELLKSHSEYKIKYFPAETFGNELISALKSKNINQFKDKYRHCDCILVDDIQFIAGKEYIQEEFFHTFNALHLNGKQIILTSDRKPSDIKELQDRLVSRFMGGLTVDIQSPDFEMRSAIIMQKAQEKGISIDSEAVQYLADHLQSNTRDIEGKIQEISVMALSKQIHHLSLEFVEGYFQPSTFSSSSSSNSATALTPRHLISVCAKQFNLKTSDLCGPSRKKELVSARHITAYLLLTESKLSLEEVGHLLGGRDHTSVMHARDKVQSDISTNPQIRQVINQIKGSL